MANSSNDFKAAAERKKRMSESRKMQRFIGQLEETLNAPNDKLDPEDLASAQAALDKLKEFSVKDSTEIDVIITANENAQRILDHISEKLKAAEEKPAPVEEVTPNQETEAEKVKSVPETPLEENSEVTEETETETIVETPVKQATNELTEEEKEKQKLSNLLYHLYSSPRYSRLKGERKRNFNAAIKPTLIEKMRADQQEGKITSPSDLINSLLEIFYGEY